MSSRTLRLAIVFLSLPAVTASAFAADTDSIRSGREIARGICAECHAVRPAELQSPNKDAPSFEDIASVSGITPIALRVALTTSHKTMPNLILSGQQLDDVIAYILSLPEGR